MRTMLLTLAVCASLLRCPAPVVVNSYRFASAWTPASITGLAVWGDATRETGFANNDPVASAADFSGNSRVATQGTAANKPLYKTSVIGSKSSFYFDGSNDYLQLPAAYYPFNSDYTIALVIVPTLVDGNWHTVLVQGGAGRAQFIGLNGGFPGGFNDRPISFGNTGTTYGYGPVATASTPYYLVVTKSGTTLTYYQNGTVGTTVGSSFDTNSTDRVALGIYYDLTVFPWQGYISEWCIWPSAVSGSDLTNLQAYLAAKAAP